MGAFAPKITDPAFDINPADWPNFNEEYQSLLKKFNIKEGTPQAQKLFEITKVKVVELEAAKFQFPENFEKFKAGYATAENDIASYTPTIRPAVEEAFDTKNHPFVTDPVGAYIFASACEFFDREDFSKQLQRDQLGMTPRKRAEIIWANKYARRQFFAFSHAKQIPASSPKGDMPGWLVAFFDSLSSEEKPQSKAEGLDLLFPKKHAFMPETGFSPLKGKELREFRVDQIAKDEGYSPDAPEYKQIQEELKDLLEEVPPPYLATYQATMASISERTQALAKSFEADLLNTDKNVLAEEVHTLRLKYSGEHGMVRSGIRSYLLENPAPSAEQKLKFMKLLREAVQQRRKANGIIVHHMFPSLAYLRTPKVCSDEELTKKFDQIAADL